MKRYNPTELEPKWQKIWDKDQVYKADLMSDKQKYIAMSMFNYPSGAGIHIGHAMNYTVSDVMARYKRQAGYESYHPVGWDAFGLPAENFAIKSGISPQASMAKTIPSYHNQYKAMGWSNDWSREISTHLPVYYKWTQWIFSEMYRAGLAYQEPRMQWWCTKCQTVLANEQVIDGKCWRHDAADDPEVAKKEVKQWFFKVTEYADEMLAATDDLDWSEVVKSAQKNWIGKSRGAEIEFAIAGSEARDSLKFTPELTRMILDGKKTCTIRLDAKKLEIGDIAEFMTRDGELVAPFGYAKITRVRSMKLGDIPNDLKGHEVLRDDAHKLKNYRGYYGDQVNLETKFTIYDFEFDFASRLSNHDSTVTVFTTHPDTIFGATFLVIAPEHEMLRQIVTDDARGAVEEYVKQALKKSELERQEEKVKTGVPTGAHAINPATGEKIPIWVADYVLSGYGTGAIMAVPAHDERDYEFATKFQLPIRRVVVQDFGTVLPEPKDVTGPVVIGYDPKTQEYMSLINKNSDNMRWLVSGGLEKGETYEEAARRELREEAGFVEVQQLIQLGEPTMSYYFNPNKKSNRRSYSFMYLAILDKTSQIAQSQEETENYDVVWGSADDIEKDFIKERDSSAEDGISHWIDGLSRAREAVRAYHRSEQYAPEIYRGEGCMINSGRFDGMRSEEAREEIVAWLEQQGLGRAKTTYKIRDWSVSRQRYWGAPIPIVTCEKDGTVLVPDSQLPVVLPELEDFAPSGDGRSALARASDWLNTTCPKCGGPAERETDTLDTYICSSWYFLRYFDGTNEDKIFDSVIANKWMPIDFYNGGDHATAHMIYARFVTRFFWHQGLLDNPEPFKKFLFNGKVTASDGTMFSKSKGNGVDPLEIISQGYGADALRTYLMFAAPLEQWIRWDPQGVPGTYRFLSRVWNLVQEYVAANKISDNDAVLKLTHPVIKKVTGDLEDQKYNTAIAAMMELTNSLYVLKAKDGFGNNWQPALESLVALVAPFAPHMADELWHDLGRTTSVQRDSWPKWDEIYLVSDTMTIIVQVNGKLRAKLEVSHDETEGEIKKIALSDENVQKFVSGEPKKVIYVKNKLVNIVV